VTFDVRGGTSDARSALISLGWVDAADDGEGSGTAGCATGGWMGVGASRVTWGQAVGTAGDADWLSRGCVSGTDGGFGDVEAALAVVAE
jgi:hypothetical protein